MLTNEQRAHDLAIYMLDQIKDSKIQEQIAQGTTAIGIDFYKEYKNLYFLILESVNRDFSPND